MSGLTGQGGTANRTKQDDERLGWRQDEAASRAEAERRVARLIETGGDTLELTDLGALTAFPDSLGQAPTLRRLFAGSRSPEGRWNLDKGTRIRALIPLSDLTGPTTLDLTATAVTDLSILLELPRFRDDQGAELVIRACAAADPRRDVRLSGLSSLSPRECAVEVVRYLSSEDSATAPRPLSDRLAAASPVALTVSEGRLAAADAGAPERDRPAERALRLRALRDQVSHLIEEAAERQVPRTIQRSLARHAVPLAEEERIFLLLDGRMGLVRAGLSDPFLVERLDAAFVGGWRQLCAMHDELRPLLLPPDEEDLPQPSPEATPEEAERIADGAIAVLEGQPEIDPSVPEALRAGKDYLALAKNGGAEAFAAFWRGLLVIRSILSGLGTAAKSLAALGVFLATPWGQSLLTQLRPPWEALSKLFAP